MARTRGRGSRRGVAGRGGHTGRGGMQASPPKDTVVMKQEVEFDVTLLFENAGERPSKALEEAFKEEEEEEDLKEEEEEDEEDLREEEDPSKEILQMEEHAQEEEEESVGEDEEEEEEEEHIMTHKRKVPAMTEEQASTSARPLEVTPDELDVRIADVTGSEPAAKRRRGNTEGTEPKRSRFPKHKSVRHRSLKPGVFARAWTLEDKQTLLEALQRHGPDHPKKIQKSLPHKSLLDVREMIFKLAGRAQRQSRKDSGSSSSLPVKSSAAIEGWLDLCQALAQTVPDYSWTISKVVSMLKTLEYHDPSTTDHMPSYERLYAYLQNLLSPTPTVNMPKLSLVEAAIFLDLVEDLAQTLKGLATEEQRELMTWKAGSLLSAAKEQVPANYSVAHTWRALMQTFPNKAMLETAMRKQREESDQSSAEMQASTSRAANEQPASFKSTNQQPASFESTNQQPASFESTNKQQASLKSTNQSAPEQATDIEVAAIMQSKEIQHQEAKTTAAKSKAESSSASSSEPMKDLDVSQPQLTVLKSPRSTKEIVEVDGVKINMDMNEHRKESLYSINPFAIPVQHLRPFRTRPELCLPSEKLDKILQAKQKARKGAGPLPLSAYTATIKQE